MKLRGCHPFQNIWKLLPSIKAKCAGSSCKRKTGPRPLFTVTSYLISIISPTQIREESQVFWIRTSLGDSSIIPTNIKPTGNKLIVIIIRLPNIKPINRLKINIVINFKEYFVSITLARIKIGGDGYLFYDFIDNIPRANSFQIARAILIRANPPRGLEPTSTLGCRRVARTILLT